MRTIQKLMISAALASAFAVAGPADYSQPVKEVEKEARLAVRGTCYLNWNGTEEGSRDCLIAEVPAGKVLAIRSFSVSCESYSSGNEGFTKSALVSTDGVHISWLPLTNANAEANRIIRIGNALLFHHVPGGQRTFFRTMFFRGPNAGVTGATCNGQYEGFLMDILR